MFKLSAAARAVDAQLHGADAQIVRVTTDSRDVCPGDLFVAIKGPNVMQGYWNKPEQTDEVFTDEAGLARFGDLGVVALLFFVGMEVSLPHLVSSWRVQTCRQRRMISASPAAPTGS